MGDVFSSLFEMTAFGVLDFKTVIMWIIAFVLLYLGIWKEYEPLLLVPIGFGVLLANLPGAGLGIVDASAVQYADRSYMNLPEIASEYGIMNFLYYSLIKTGLLPHYFYGSRALTDFGPMLRNLKLSFLVVPQLGIFRCYRCAVLIGFSLNEAGSLAIIAGPMVLRLFIPLLNWLRICWGPSLLLPILIWRWCCDYSDGWQTC